MTETKAVEHKTEYYVGAIGEWEIRCPFKRDSLEKAFQAYKRELSLEYPNFDFENQNQLYIGERLRFQEDIGEDGLTIAVNKSINPRRENIFYVVRMFEDLYSYHETVRYRSIEKVIKRNGWNLLKKRTLLLQGISTKIIAGDQDD